MWFYYKSLLEKKLPLACASFKVTVVWEITNFIVHFLTNLMDKNCCRHILLVGWSSCKIYFAQMRFKRASCGDEIFMFNIVMGQGTCEQICFKLGMMPSTTKGYNLIPFWMTFMFILGHKVIRNQHLSYSSMKQLKCLWSLISPEEVL